MVGGGGLIGLMTGETGTISQFFTSLKFIGILTQNEQKVF